MEMMVFAIGRNKNYDSIGIFDGKQITVKKGSRISEKVSKRIQPIVSTLRNDKSLVSVDHILLRDVKFKSPSTAASFVAGTISNGMLIWRNEEGKTLKTLQEK